MLRVKTLYRKGLPAQIDEEFDSMDTFARYVDDLFQSHRDAGSKAGMWMELTSECTEELHVGVSEIGWALTYVLSIETGACIGIMHSSLHEEAHHNFQYAGEINVGALHPRDEALKAIWRWSLTGRLDLYLRECVTCSFLPKPT